MNTCSAISAQLVTAQNKSELLSGTPAFFKLICNLLLRLEFGNVILNLPDGRSLRFSGAREIDAVGIVNIRDFTFARRTVLGSDLGFFESYAQEEWDTPQLADCLYIFARNADHIQSAFHAHPVIGWAEQLRHYLRKNTHAGARKNIMAHYDLGNEFYEKWLDTGMTYSSALFRPDTLNLEEAQLQKYQTLANTMMIGPNDEVLEIGSGWGGFAEFTARDIGAHITSITISKAQFEYAQKRIFKAGLNEKVNLELRDYRDMSGTFDKIASIEMYEAVGKEYWSDYFAKISQCLKPGGSVGIQAITIAERYVKDYERSPDFIQRHVFPGGMLASPSEIFKRLRAVGLFHSSAMPFGLDYARTLLTWHERFLEAWEEIKPLGFDQRFKKTWQFYLAYCEAGFRAATTDVYQICAVKN